MVRWLIGIAVVAVATVGCDDPEVASPSEPTDDAGLLPESPADVPAHAAEQIYENPEEWYGEAVSLNGEVTRTYGEHAFLLNGEGLLADESIAVVADHDVVKRDRVLVSGTVERLSIGDAEERLGIDIDDEVLDALVGQDVVVATEVQPFDGDDG